MSKYLTYSELDQLNKLLNKTYYYFLDLNNVWGLTDKEHTHMLTLIEELIPLTEKVNAE